MLTGTRMFPGFTPIFCSVKIARLRQIELIELHMPLAARPFLRLNAFFGNLEYREEHS